jgi:hypothetical protein
VQKLCQQLPGGYAIRQIIKLKEENKYAVGTWGNGLHIIEINLTTYEFKKDETIYLQGKYISDIIELEDNILLASSYSECSYFIINLSNQEEKFLAKGYSPYALGLLKFKNFSY